MKNLFLILVVISFSLASQAQDKNLFNQQHRKNVIKADLFLPLVYGLPNNEGNQNYFMFSYERFIKPTLSFQVNASYYNQLSNLNSITRSRGFLTPNFDTTTYSFEQTNKNSSFYIRPNVRWFFSPKSKIFNGVYLNGGVNLGYYTYRKKRNGITSAGESLAENHKYNSLVLGGSAGAGWEFLFINNRLALDFNLSYFVLTEIVLKDDYVTSDSKYFSKSNGDGPIRGEASISVGYAF